MATKIRLARGGSKKRPFYRIVIADERAPRDGNFIEKIGNFNPMVPKDHKERVVISKERAEHWLKVGAQPTDRVQRILADLGMMEAPKITEKTKKHLPKAKAQERIKAKEEAALKAEEDAKAAAEAAKAEAEKPAEEPAAEEQPQAEAAPENEAVAEETPAATEEAPAASEEAPEEPEAVAEEEQPKE
jgi:small subunit ribosomal protein S16|tara:strand:- start:792 stop:1355 length:564 start_codon:yes stop_codon:yes gene_type:complete